VLAEGIGLSEARIKEGLEMNDHFRSAFLQKLSTKKKELQESLSRLKDSQKEYDGEMTAGDFIDELDGAQREISVQSHYHLIERKVGELRKVEHLINMISNNEEFGFCEECGQPIPEERLLVVPEADLCVACQRELEKSSSRRKPDQKSSRNVGGKMDWEEAYGIEDESNTT
jgi:DnaK suppressor protein